MHKQKVFLCQMPHESFKQILSVCLSFLLQVANDGPGKQILDELQGDGIDTSNVVVRLLL